MQIFQVLMCLLFYLVVTCLTHQISFDSEIQFRLDLEENMNHYP